MSNTRYEYSQHEQNLEHVENQKLAMEANYMKSIDILEKEMNEIDRRIGVAKSSVKRELLTKQYQYLEDMSQKFDQDFETKKGELDEVIKETKERMKILSEQIKKEKNSLDQETKERMKILSEQIKKEKNSLDHNIDQLKKYMNNPGSYTMTQVLEKVVNSLEILREGGKKKKSTSS
jgi:hypothetical protein